MLICPKCNNRLFYNLDNIFSLNIPISIGNAIKSLHRCGNCASFIHLEWKLNSISILVKEGK